MAHITFEASAKLKMADVRGHRFHVERKYKNHKNPNVDVNRTYLNVDYTPQLRDGLPDNPQERIFARLENRTGKLQENHVILRPLILQPSPEIFEGMTTQEQRDKMHTFVQDVMPWVFAKFGGTKNIMSVISHFDEKNPHLHLSILPMTVDGMTDKDGSPIKPGRISQTAFFTGPKQLGILHRDIREYMNGKGWDFSVENKHEGKQTRATEKQMRDFGAQILQARADHEKAMCTKEEAEIAAKEADERRAEAEAWAGNAERRADDLSDKIRGLQRGVVEQNEMFLTAFRRRNRAEEAQKPIVQRLKDFLLERFSNPKAQEAFRRAFSAFEMRKKKLG